MPISQRIVQVCLFLFAAIALFGGTLQMYLGQPETTPRLDNIHRFLAGIYLGCGFIVLWAAITIRTQGTLIYLIALAGFLGGEDCERDDHRGGGDPELGVVRPTQGCAPRAACKPGSTNPPHSLKHSPPKKRQSAGYHPSDAISLCFNLYFHENLTASNLSQKNLPPATLI